MPKENEEIIEKLSEDVKKDMEFVYVGDYSEVFQKLFN